MSNSYAQEWDEYDEAGYTQENSAYDYQPAPAFSYATNYMQPAGINETIPVSSASLAYDTNLYSTYPSYSDPTMTANLCAPAYGFSEYDQQPQVCENPLGFPVGTTFGTDGSNEYTSSSQPSTMSSNSYNNTPRHSDSSDQPRNPMRATKKERGPPKSLTSVFPSNPSSEPQRKSRRPFSPEGKKKVEAVRSVGACVQCRTRKRTCDTSRPCNSCVKRTSNLAEAAALCQPQSPSLGFEKLSVNESRQPAARESRRHGHH